MTWVALDTMTIAGRNLSHLTRQPFQLIINLLFPVMMVLMFGYLLGGGMAAPDGASYREYLMPGMFALTMVFGLEATFTAVAADAAKGVTDRFRSMPIAGAAVVVGRSAADLLNSALGLAVMLACGLAVGWGWHNGPIKALAAIGLLLLLRVAMLWIGIYLGLLTRSPEALVTVQILVWPVAFLANTLVPPGTMPGWLGTIAEWNPLSSTVAATRDLFGNPGWADSGSWVATHPVLMAVVWPVALTAIFLPLSVHRYRRLSR